jgi:hypothetical protein
MKIREEGDHLRDRQIFYYERSSRGSATAACLSANRIRSYTALRVQPGGLLTRYLVVYAKGLCMELMHEPMIRRHPRLSRRVWTRSQSLAKYPGNGTSFQEETVTMDHDARSTFRAWLRGMSPAKEKGTSTSTSISIRHLRVMHEPNLLC